MWEHWGEDVGKGMGGKGRGWGGGVAYGDVGGEGSGGWREEEEREDGGDLRMDAAGEAKHGETAAQTSESRLETAMVGVICLNEKVGATVLRFPYR